MKRIARSLLVLTVLLVVAQPTFACIVCNWDGNCIYGGPGPRCKWTIGSNGCVDGPHCGGGSFTEPLAAEYRIASVEISHESDMKVAAATKQQPTTAPAAVAEARIDRIPE
ncbi:MAG TPA: hypothetical protein VGQ36_13375 [Thermoanaerobaculia bacterium]|jgi:hypothetical protein|nr:hypothetical protein [Thermoanaerobaculia bacterium]